MQKVEINVGLQTASISAAGMLACRVSAALRHVGLVAKPGRPQGYVYRRSDIPGAHYQVSLVRRPAGGRMAEPEIDAALIEAQSRGPAGLRLRARQGEDTWYATAEETDPDTFDDEPFVGLREAAALARAHR